MHGYDVSGIDVPSSNYRASRVWPVTDYDGRHIPFEDATFDIVFSSNTLEHVRHIRDFQKEIRRVLKAGGVAIHVLPSSSWRFWTNITYLLRRWTVPGVHGEQAGDAVTEIYYFSRRWWRRLFDETGWTIVAQCSTRLFYTGESIMDSRLGMSARTRLSRLLGSSSNLFMLQKPDVPDDG